MIVMILWILNLPKPKPKPPLHMRTPSHGKSKLLLKMLLAALEAAFGLRALILAPFVEETSVQLKPWAAT